MKTKKMVVKKVNISFSSAASHVSNVTLPRAPWEKEDEECNPVAESIGKVETEYKKPMREPRHIGAYRKS